MGADTWPTTSAVPDRPGWRFVSVERVWDGGSWLTRVTVSNPVDPRQPTLTGQAEGDLGEGAVLALAEEMIAGQE